MGRSGIKDLSHFQLRLKSFYARLCYNPWRQNILYLGDGDFIPTLSEDKIFFWGTTQPDSMHNAALPLWLSTYDELPFEAHSIDVIICHFSQPSDSESFLEECYIILAPEGKIIWTINNPSSFYYSHHPQKSLISFIKARQALIEYDFDILSMHTHSFITQSKWRYIRSFCLLQEKNLCKYLPFWANKISFVAITKTSHYSPLPSYLKLSQRVLWLCPPTSTSITN